MLKSLNLPATNYETIIDGQDQQFQHQAKRQSARTRRERTRLFNINFHCPFNESFNGYYDGSQGEECSSTGVGQGRFVHIDGIPALLAWRPANFGQVTWECVCIGQTSRASNLYATGGGPIALGQTAELWVPVRPRFDIGLGTQARVITNATATTGGNIYGTGSLYPSFGGAQIQTTLGGTAYNTIIPVLLPAYAAPSGSSWSFLKSRWSLSSTLSNPFPVAVPDISDGNNRGGLNLNIEWGEQFAIDVAIYASTAQNVGSGGGVAFNVLASGRLYCYQAGSGTYALGGYITGGGFYLDSTIYGVVTGGYGGFSSSSSSGVISVEHPVEGTLTFTLTFTQDSYHRTTGISVSTSAYATCVILPVGGPGSANQ